jgi:hypothetical protein
MPTVPHDASSHPEDDPFDRHFRREPLPGAGVRVVVLGVAEETAPAVGAAIVALLSRLGRGAELRVEQPTSPGGLGAAIERGYAGSAMPLVMVVTSPCPPVEAHLKPLLQAIDHCDHVVGKRRLDRFAALVRWLAALRWRALFAVPVKDVHAPIRLHRLEKLAAIPLQSASAFVDVELLAKATFLGHLIDEVAVPPLDAPQPRIDRQDLRRVFQHPEFVRRSAPPEQAQGQPEGDDRPGGQDQERSGDGGEPGAFEHHPAQGRDDVRQR